MGKAYFFFLIAAFVLTGATASSSTFSILRMKNATTDDSLEVIKNPALLASQREAHTLGFLFLTTPYQVHDFGIELFQNAMIYSSKNDDYGYKAGGACISYAGKIAGGAVGFAVDMTNPRALKYFRYNKIFTGTDNISIESTLKKGSSFEVSPDFVFSFGKTVSGNNALGLKLSLGYSRTNEDFSYMRILSMGIAEKHHAARKIEGLSVEASFGYEYRDDASQAGIMVRTGRFKWDTTKIYYNRADFGLPLFFAGSISNPRQFHYAESFSIVAGGYRRLGQYVAVALEGEYRVPVSVGEKRLRLDEFTGFFGVRVNSAAAYKGAYGLRGGVEFLPKGPGPVTMSAGAGIRTESQNKRARFIKESKSSDTYSAAFAVDFKFTEKIKAWIGTELSYMHERKRTASNYFISRIEDDASSLYDLNTYLGLSFGF